MLTLAPLWQQRHAQRVRRMPHLTHCTIMLLNTGVTPPKGSTFSAPPWYYA